MATLTTASSSDTSPRESWAWLLRHPIVIVGALLSVGFYGLTADFFARAVPELIGIPGIAVLGGFLYITVFVAMMLEGGHDPATRT